jgi:RNA polymerase sigma factor (sigma-70 family)
MNHTPPQTTRSQPARQHSPRQPATRLDERIRSALSARHARLSLAQQHALIQRAQAGCDAARNQLVEAFYPRIIGLATSHLRSGAPADDLVQAGVLGMIEAIARFDAARGTALSTYATFWIRKEMQDVALDQRLIRVPRDRARGFARNLLTPAQRARLAPALRCRSLDPGGLSRAGAGQTLSLRASSHQSLSPLEALARREELSWLRSQVPRLLSLRERDMLLRCAAGVSAAQVGRELGISRVRVGHINRRSLARLRASCPHAPEHA